MEEIDPFDMSDPEIVALLKEASGARAPVCVQSPAFEPVPLKGDGYGDAVIDIGVSDAPVLNDWKPKEKTRKTRQRVHFLLNTLSSVTVSNNRSYGSDPHDFDFTYDTDRNRGNLVARPRKDGSEPKAPEFARFAHIFFDCIIPNAIIAKDGGYDVTVDDACNAVYQGMRIKATHEAIRKWEEYVIKHGGNAWVHAIVEEKFNLFVLGTLSDGKRKKRYSLESYVKNQMRKHANIVVKKLKHFTRKNSPALGRLIERWKENPDISGWTFKRLHDELGYSKDTIGKFRKYVKETET